MGRYGTREAEVDDLLRRGVLVDLLQGRPRRAASRPCRATGSRRWRRSSTSTGTAEIKDGGTSIVEYERYMQTRDRSILDAIADYNEEDCVATLRAPRLAARAARRSARAVRPVPAARAGGAEGDAAGEGRARGAARGAARRGRRARGAAPRLPRARAQAGLVGVLRPDRADAGGAGRGRRLDRLARACRRARGGRAVERPRVHLSRRRSTSSGSARSRSTRRGADAGRDRRARPRGADARAQARAVARRRAAAAGADPRPTVPTPTRRRTRWSGSAARCSPATGAIRRSSRCCAASRSPRDVQTTDLDEMAELVLSLDGRHLVIQGPPGSGKTWVSGRLIARLLADGKRVGVASTSHKAIHKLLDEVEAAGIDVRGVKKATAGNPESFYDGERRRERHRPRPTASTRRSSAAPPGCYAHADLDGGSTTCSSTRRARCRSPTRSRWARARGTSCSSATRSSSRR